MIDRITSEIDYTAMMTLLGRLEAECGVELPELHGDFSPKARARRLLAVSPGETPEDWASLEWIARQ